MDVPFHDRFEAGQHLAARLQRYAHRPDVLVLGLPRGGVAVAYPVALALDAPLDVFVVRKLGVPGREELAMGALATGGIRVLNEDVVRGLGIPPAVIEQVTQRETAELRRREATYRGGRPRPELHQRTVILVDDGLATGATMRAAVEAVRTQDPGSVVVAVPVAARETCAEFLQLVDDLVCATLPEPFVGVGQWYEHF